jgi:iron complex transport system substrate-binding protein
MFRSTRTLLAVSFAALALGALVLAGCAGGPQTSSQASTAEPSATAPAFPVTITDDSSRSVTIKAQPKRIVSLAPANTEILFALGLGAKVVGVTSNDDYPSEVASITKVGGFAGPNIEAVAGAKPDLILATSGVQADVVKRLEEFGATVVVLNPKTLSEVYAGIERVGKVTGATAEATELVTDMKADVESVRRQVSGLATATAMIEIGQNPLYVAGKGTLMDELITLAGGTNVVTQPKYVSYSAEQVIKADPAVYFATEGSGESPAAIQKRPGYSALSAVKNKRVVIVEDSLVSRHGPRIVEGLKAIAEGLHPGALKPVQ